MHVRQGRPLATFSCENKDVMIFNKWELTADMMLWADQCLCARNETRTKNNLFMRELKGYSGDPKIGEKIIGLTNHWERVSDDSDEIPLTNGTIGTIKQIAKSSMRAPAYIYNRSIPIFYADIKTDDGHLFKNLKIDYHSIVNGNKLLSERQEYLMRKTKKSPNPPYDFNYSSWLSVWKFQGSQANKILLLEENFPWDKEEHIKYLYSGITRAIDKCVIIKK